jgi:hypothetical protein
MTLDVTPAHSELRNASFGQAYNEAAFKYFLEVDRRRIRRSDRSILLVLVSVRERSGRNALLTEELATQLFAGLAASVREVDFVGWYRHDRVLGAVMPQAASAPADLRNLISRRVLQSLERHVARDHAGSLRVRVAVLGGKEAQ